MATSLGQLVTEWRAARAQRLAKQKETDALKEREKELHDTLLDRLDKSVNKAVKADGRIVQVVTKEIPAVSDWKALWAHIMKTGETDLVQQRVSPVAVRERWENDKKVPGVSALSVTSISDTKAA